VAIGQWVVEFERQHWTKKERTKDAELNYRTDYGAIFEKIDLDKAISIDRLKSAIANSSKPDTRTRVRWCNALGKLAECAGIDRQQIRDLRGNYSITSRGRGGISTRHFKRLGVEIECYTLRHFHAIQLILGGIDSATAAKWMGHSQLMFDRVYLHWMDERHHRKLFDRLVDK
jgi:hypothetical protein